MSIFFATPMYGGQCTTQFHRSAMALGIEMTKAGVEFDWATPFNESLITRARNNLVAEFLKTDYQALMFIDADIEFPISGVSKLWEMICDGAGVACGAYPMKRIDNPPSAWVKGKLVNLSDLSGPVEVDYAGTGFFMINREPIEKMIDFYKGLEYEESGKKHALFDTSINRDVYLSEDYTFCSRYRAMGGRIMLDPSIKLGHVGTFTYSE